jgi:glycosyltransferase involved in cell wall biosynthesis
MDIQQVKNPESILIMIHCAEHTGYAIASLEKVFLASARLAGFAEHNIFWSFQSVTTTPNPQIIACDYNNPDTHKEVSALIKKQNITLVLAFDLGFPCPIISVLKKSGVKRIITYWGAGMSSINTGLKLKLKQLECLLTRNKPDVFIFESDAMRKTATHGRGLKASATDIVYLGVDVDKFTPHYNNDNYAYNTLNIPLNQKIVFYSGHMEERKGVRVIVQAAIELIDNLHVTDVHFVICGNKNNEALPYEVLLENKIAKNHVTFAGYRNDMAELMRGSHIGVIASTGWDSFTMSSVEMMASGLPLIVSNLQGLSETIEDHKNGFLITPGDFNDLAHKIQLLIANPELAVNFSVASRARATQMFSMENQIAKMADVIRSAI